MSSRLHTHSKLPKPKISLNRSPQRPKASARRQTNNYITPLSKTLGRNIVPASPKDPPKRGRYLDESNRPGQKPAKPHHRRPNLCGVSLPSAAGSTPQPASSFESPLMAELREQYNKTPSPERLLPRPAMVRFAAIADSTRNSNRLSASTQVVWTPRCRSISTIDSEQSEEARSDNFKGYGSR